MKDGFIKVSASVPNLKVADIEFNTAEIKKIITKANEQRVNLLVFPELSITGSTCKDLFFSETLISASEKAVEKLTHFTRDFTPCVIIGAPLSYNSKLYNCAVILKSGKILGIVPKAILPCNCNQNESRYFESGLTIEKDTFINIGEFSNIPFGSNLIFKNISIKEFTFCVEINTNVSYRNLTLNGANIVVNLASVAQTIGKTETYKQIISADSVRLGCGYVFASSGIGESTTDAVFGGYALIAEKGKTLAEKEAFENNTLIISEFDVKNIVFNKQKNIGANFITNPRFVEFESEITETKLTRTIDKNPFLPCGLDSNSVSQEILKIQSYALARRIEHTNCQKAVIGISGGLDSTLALLVAVRALKILGRNSSDILAITMPCFGTTKRTRSNSEILCNELGVDFKEINITQSVKQHFLDIGQSEDSYDVTFENSQARERTQVLMDIANKENGLVIGTGDLSELALGWATYNGDHMSMYGVNAGVPKTLIRYIVKYEAENSNETLKSVLFDILDTPVSPELLPANTKGEIEQKTEDLVGPYELHDFFIYHTIACGESPKKIYRLARIAFPEYEKDTIIHWLKVFTKRFFAQQFKRSCLPDGPQVCEISLSPRGGWQMPTDAFYSLWLREIENI